MFAYSGKKAESFPLEFRALRACHLFLGYGQMGEFQSHPVVTREEKCYVARWVGPLDGSSQ